MRIAVYDEASKNPVTGFFFVPDGSALPNVGEYMGIEENSGGEEYVVVRRWFTFHRRFKRPVFAESTPDEIAVFLYVRQINEQRPTEPVEQRSGVHESVPSSDEGPGAVHGQDDGAGAVRPPE